jgi:ribose 1,5-bisphosphate isomerase
MADLKKVQQVVQDIKDIKVQGATNIAKAAFQVLIDELNRQTFTTIGDIQAFLLPAMDTLEKARPTEPMMFNGMSYIKNKTQEASKKSDVSCPQFLSVATEATTCYLGMITTTAHQAIEQGIGILNYGDNVLTHCHSSSAIKTIIANKAGGKDFLVYNTETRPLYQGHKTAKDFLEA